MQVKELNSGYHLVQLSKLSQSFKTLIPNTWEVKKLKDITEINPGVIDVNYSNDKILYIDIGSIERFEIQKYEHFDLNKRPSRAQRIVKKNDIIVSTVRPYLKAFTKISDSKPNLICSTGFAVLRPRNSDDVDFIFNYIKSPIFDANIIRHMEGMAYPAVTSKMVEDTLIPYPTYKNERFKIGSIFLNLNELIKKIDQVIEQTQSLKKGLMQRLFGKRTRYLSNTPIIRQYQKFDGREFEMEYKTFTIDEIKASSPNAITMGPFGSNITVDNFVPSGVPVIRGVNLTEEPFNLKGFVFLTEDKADELKSANAFPGDIVFTHRGTLGQVGIIPDNTKYKRYVVSQSQMKLTCNRNKTEPLYVYYFFRSSQGQRALLSNISGTGVPAIGQPTTSLRRIMIPLPRLQEQRRIAKIFSTENEFVQKKYEERSKLETLKKGLMQKLLTGKIRVKV